MVPKRSSGSRKRLSEVHLKGHHQALGLGIKVIEAGRLLSAKR
ncbi:hypothetical protein [Halomonas ventosae]|nr:hypothetical protein [Halomonas ventosae]